VAEWPYATVLVTKQDVKSGFTSGDRHLDKYFADNAVRNGRADLGQTYVLRGGPSGVQGYYTLVSGSVATDDIRALVEQNLPRYERLGAILLGRFAVQKELQGQGKVGPALLEEALRRSVGIADQAGCVGVYLDAKNDGAARFYQRYGFSRIGEPEALQMFVSMKKVRASIQAAQQEWRKVHPSA
jgi:predicted GNAT family N-acyltransferase